MRERGIIAIVEGIGDERALPALIRRILHERLLRYDIGTGKSQVAKGKENLVGKFEKFVEYAMDEDPAAILVLVDADEDCPVELASRLARRADALNAPVPIAIVCAKSEYETWFICSLSDSDGDGIRRNLGLPPSVVCPENAESIRNAKGWLSNRMPRNRAYREISNQDALTHHIAINLVREKSRSFRRLCDAVGELADAVDAGASDVTPGFG